MYKANYNDFISESNSYSTIKNIDVKDDFVYFNTHRNNNSSYTYIGIKLKDFFIKNLFYILGIVFFIVSLYINKIRIKEIVFNMEHPINYEIEEYINSNSTNLYKLKFLNKSLYNINNEIRIKYYTYEWISINKKGNTLYVNITHNTINEIKNEETSYTKLISTKKGIIKYYKIHSGLSNNLEYNRSISENEILVEGNNPKGIILAETYTLKDISIPIIKEDTIYTLNNINTYNLSLFKNKKSIYFKKNTFEKYDIKEKQIFNFFNIITLKKIELKEKSDIITLYGKEEAYEYAISTIKKDFISKRISNLEQIYEVYTLTETKTDTSYEYTFLIKSLENIAIPSN